MKDKLTEIVTSWANEAGIKPWKETVAIHVEDNVLYIVTQHPGYFIGKTGELCEKYTQKIKDSGYDLKVSFVDIFCGGVVFF